VKIWLVFLLLCLPAAAQPEAALQLWHRLQESKQALAQADPAAIRLLYQELYFEAADCKLYKNQPFSPKAETVRGWLAPSYADSLQLEAILQAEKLDFTGQASPLGRMLDLYQQAGTKAELKPAALAEAERLQIEFAVAALSLEAGEVGLNRAEAIWLKWQHNLGLMFCDVLRGNAAPEKDQLAYFERAAGRTQQIPNWRAVLLERMAAIHTKAGRLEAAAMALQSAIEAQAEYSRASPEDVASWKKLGSLETLRGAALAAAGEHAQASQAYGRGEAARNQAYKLEKTIFEAGLEKAAKATNPLAVYVASDAYLSLLETIAAERSDWETRAQVAQRRVELARIRQDWSGVATALEAQGQAFLEKRPQKARALALEAMQVRRQKLADKELQRSLVLLSKVAYEQNNWAECLKLHQQVIELARPGATPPVHDVENSPDNLRAIHLKINFTARQSAVQNAFYARLGVGQVQQIMGNYRAATQEFDRLESDLGLLLLAGLVDEEERLRNYTPRPWRQVYQDLKAQKVEPERVNHSAMIANGLEAVLTTQRGRLLAEQGDLDGASRTYHLAIERTTEMLGGSYPLVGAYMALASLEMDQGRYAAAEGPLQTALEQYVRNHNPAGTAGALGQLSALRRRQARPLEAVRLARQGLELAQTLPDPVRQANLFCSLGLAESELGGSALNDAEKHLRQAVSTYRDLSMRGALAYSLSGLGQTLERLQRDKEALEAYREAVALVELLATEVSSGDLQMFNGSRANAELYDRLIRLLLKGGQPDESFRYLERYKAKSLMDALSGLQIEAGDPKVQSLLLSVQKLAIQLRKAEKDRTRGLATSDSLRSLESRYREAVARLQKTDPSYAGLVSVGPTDLARVRQRLPQGTLLLEYFLTADQLHVFLVSADHGPQVFSAPISRRKLVLAVSELRGRIKDRQDLEGLSQELYMALIGPVQSQVNAARTLVIVPGGELYHLPFQALLDPNGQFLIEKKTIAYLSQADLLPSGSAARAPDEARLLALGNPDSSLPAATREVREIGRLFTGAEVFVEKSATLAQLARSRPVPTYLHLATHGVFNGLDPKESSLLMAGMPAHLRVRDLLEGRVSLRLQGNRLVTLSACQTHMGGNNPSALYGSLSRAFSKIGAPSVVASLWSVEDESTRQLMTDFYSQLAQGKPRGESLASAQRKLLASKEFSHPYYWAPFVLLGDWR